MREELARFECEQMTVQELKDMCRERGISGYSRLRKADLVERCCLRKEGA